MLMQQRNQQYTINANSNNMNRISTGSIQPHQQQLQQNHINELMTTAAAGTGVVGDVDALLTPIPCIQLPRVEARPERNLWRTDEIIDMLEIMQKLNAIELLNDKSIKSEKVFRNVENRMREHGYYKKTHVQIWTKWKFLKSTYTTSKRNGTLPSIPHRIYEMLHKMLFRGINSDCNNSATSLDDGENSNTSGGCGGGNIVISGVEGGYTNGKQTVGDSEDENGFGMAHPIFGFRLGLVKPEPADTGYETITNNGVTTDNDPLEENNATSSRSSSAANVQFQTEIKQEIEDNIASPPAPSPIALRLMEQINTPEILIRKRPVRITSIAPPVTAPACKVQIPSKLHTSSNDNGSGSAPLPPLRIAPFAKVASANANAIQQPLTRPPPPLSMHPAAAAAAARNARLNNCLTDNGIQRKLMKSTTELTPAQNIIPIRLPKEITLQTRTSAAPATVHSNMLRLKQVPTRKTPYSLRPDRMIPDLDSSTSPPALKQMQRQQYNPYQEIPSTSRQALNANLMTKKRKRRLELPCHEDITNSATDHNVKIPRLYATYSQDYKHDVCGDNDGENEDNNSSMFDGSAAQQQQSHSFKPSKKEQEFFDSALKDLSTSLRQLQREMIGDFFKKQMDLARQEHVFQMRQDQLIMEAFEEQTRNIMTSAKKLLGLDLDNIKGPNDGQQENQQQQQECKEAKFLESKMQKAQLKKQLKAEHTQLSLANENQAAPTCTQAHEANNEAEAEDEYEQNNQISFRDDSFLQQHHNTNDTYEENENDNDKDEDDDDDDEGEGEEDDNDDDDDDDDDDADDGDDVDDTIDNDAYESTANVEATEHDDAEMGNADADADDETDGEDEDDNNDNENDIDNIADPIQLVSSELIES